MIKYGIHAALEAEADRILKESLAGVTSQSAKSDILTPWKAKDRRDREVYVASGTPDVSTRHGMYHRAWNPTSPHLNSVDGIMGRRARLTSLQEHTDTYHLGTGPTSFRLDEQQ